MNISEARFAAPIFNTMEAQSIRTYETRLHCSKQQRTHCWQPRVTSVFSINSSSQPSARAKSKQLSI